MKKISRYIQLEKIYQALTYLKPLKNFLKKTKIKR